MNRRDFVRSLTAGALTLAVPGFARADETRDAYLASLPAHPRLGALKDFPEETLGGTAVIEGHWPAGIKGHFYRNGPARFELGGERYHHWFDGDGMVHAWHIESGHVRHEARFVRTQKYVNESAASQFLYPAIGTKITRRPAGNNDTINTANTNVLPHAGKLYALWEGGSAIELDPANLSTRGIKTWRGDLAAMPFSAHPRITPDGVLWNFGVATGADRLLLWRIDPDGSLGKFGMIEVPNLPMVHDFVVTARYMVFLIPSFEMGDMQQSTWLEAQRWTSHRPMRAVVVDRADFTLRRIIDLPAGMVFHLGNGWDEGHMIRVHACISADDSGLRAAGAMMRGDILPPSRTDLMLITLDLTRGTARRETLLGGTEFPRVAASDTGARYQRLYVTTSQDTIDFGMTGVAAIDVESGRVDRYEYGPNWVVEEHIPVPKASGKGQWLLGTAWDVRRRQTVLTVFDGARLAQGPVAQARLPYAAPLCFHGNFLAT